MTVITRKIINTKKVRNKNSDFSSDSFSQKFHNNILNLVFAENLSSQMFGSVLYVSEISKCAHFALTFRAGHTNSYKNCRPILTPPK